MADFFKILFSKEKKTKEQIFLISTLVVNGGNYLYNLLLGRILGPELFADAAILITFLLVLSFIGMTFQIVSAKYVVLFEMDRLQSFVTAIRNWAIKIGVLLAFFIVFFSKELQDIFHTKTSIIFILFAFGVPIYFLMSINRGIFQGRIQFDKLSRTYLYEMMSRLLFTILGVLIVTRDVSSIVVSLGILISFLIGVFPFQKEILKGGCFEKPTFKTKEVLTFFMLTAFYELTQIIINNSDIILVKHFFDDLEAGLYASLALIGRVVYFVAWMFVMLLLPQVIQMKKEGKDTLPILMKYVIYVLFLSISIVGFTALFPEFVVKIMFGKEYLSISNLLWKYALATSLFALANIFAYYFLSIQQYFPVLMSGILGLTQIGLIILYHENLEQVVNVQIIAMVILLFFQLTYFLLKSRIITNRISSN